MKHYSRDEKMFGLRWLLCGILIGAGAILPGVSGGVLAVIFDIYRPFMEVLTAPRTAVRKYWRGFIPLSFGWCVGFLAFAKGIAAAFSSAGTVTTWLFIGLIAGTLPSLFREAGKKGHTKGGWGSMLFCGSAVFVLLYYVSHVADIAVQPNFLWYNFCGVLWGMGIVIPGMTTSSILMALGLYQPMLEGLARLDLLVLSACLPGMLVTMVLLARGVQWLFRRHYSVAFHGIAGIVTASTLVIIPRTYTGTGQILLCALFCVCGAALALLLEHWDTRENSV